MKLRVIYDEMLRTKVAPVTVFDAQLKKEAEEMLSVMHSYRGIGLAANQVGLNKQLIVYELIPDKTDKEQKDLPTIPRTILANAWIVKFSKEKEVINEGCLSLPGLELPVERSLGVTVEAQNLDGKKVTIKAKGLHARVLQHEIDHTNGILFTDRAKELNVLKHYVGAKIVFFGSDEFSAEVFRGLTTAGLNVMAVICESDKPSGRGGVLKPVPMAEIATAVEVPVFKPESKSEIAEILAQLSPHLVVLASYGKILPENVLEIPTFGCLNVHPSLLPKYRGATPLQSAILAGEKATGVTVMKMNAGVDTGEIVAQTSTEIVPDETFLTLRDRLSAVGSQCLVKNIPTYLAGQAKLQRQGIDATQTVKFSKDMGEIDWEKSYSEIDRQIRALNPWPGTFTFVGEQRLKILTAEIKDGELALQTVQLEGKNAVTWTDFVRGHAQQLKKESWYGKIA